MRIYLILVIICAGLVISTSCTNPTPTSVTSASPITEIPLEFQGDAFFSSDGSVLTTLSYYSSEYWPNKPITAVPARVQVWDTITGTLLHTIMEDDVYIEGNYHPFPDLVSIRHTYPDSPSLEFWDPKSGTLRLEVPDDLINIWFSPDGKTFLAGVNPTGVYNAETGERMRYLEDPSMLMLEQGDLREEYELPSDTIFAVFQFEDKVSPNRQTQLTLIDINSGRKVEFPNIANYDFSPNGQQLVTITREGVAEVWNIGQKTKKSGLSVEIEDNDGSLSDPNDFAKELPLTWFAFSNPLYEVTIISTSDAIDTCTYSEPSTNTTNNLIKKQISYTVTLSNLETDQETQQIFKGGEPGDCPTVHTFQLPGVPEPIFGTPPSKQEFKNWLTSELSIDKLNQNSSNYTVGTPNQFIEDAVFLDDVHIGIFYSNSTSLWNGSREINLEKLGISERDSVILSPDGKQILSLQANTLTVSKLDSLETLFAIDVSLLSKDKESSIDAFGYTPNGKAIWAFKRWSGNFYNVWDSATGKLLLSVENVDDWAQSKNGQYLAVIQQDRIGIWEIDKLK